MILFDFGVKARKRFKLCYTCWAGRIRCIIDIELFKCSLDKHFCSHNQSLFPKTLYRFHQPILCPYRHLGNAEGGFYLCVADDIVFSEFLHAEWVEGEVEPTAKFGDAVHQPFWQTPDVRFLSHCLADDCNQFIGGKYFVVSLL